MIREAKQFWFRTIASVQKTKGLKPNHYQTHYQTLISTS
jgi:hypothetical protein